MAPPFLPAFFKSMLDFLLVGFPDGKEVPVVSMTSLPPIQPFFYMAGLPEHMALLVPKYNYEYDILCFGVSR